MSRAVWTLLGGVLATLLIVLLITPIPFLTSRGFVLVGLTAAAGAVVLAVVGRRATLRRAADELDRLDQRDRATTSGGPPHHLPHRRPDVTGTTDRWTDEESDRG